MGKEGQEWLSGTWIMFWIIFTCIVRMNRFTRMIQTLHTYERLLLWMYWFSNDFQGMRQNRSWEHIWLFCDFYKILFIYLLHYVCMLSHGYCFLSYSFPISLVSLYLCVSHLKCQVPAKKINKYATLWWCSY